MMKPVSHENVELNDGFWAPRIRANRDVTIPAEYEQMVKTGHIGAWTWKKGAPKTPHIFWDSDLAKWIEAVAYSLMHRPDPELEKQVDGVVELMEKAQAADGYLNSHFLKVEPEKRWTNLRDQHELYCAGHLIEGAVAYYLATGKRRLLDVMTRYVDLIDRVFGREEGKIRGYCGHPEIELALVRLFKVTGDRKHLELAKYFVDQRGTKPNFFEMETQKRGEKWPGNFLVPLVDNLPVRKQTEAVGHAVRACYLYSAMADLAAETGDRGLLKACRKIWRNIVERRMYIIGGVGSSQHHERFTFDYDLPNEEAYAETCANIALVFFAHRMLQIEPDRDYSDVIERALYNGVISGVSLDGRRFFYDNRLAVHPENYKYHAQKEPMRREWFGCACCPPNISRTLASLGGYVYSQDRDALFVHLYIQGRAELEIAGGRVVVEQKTAYPWDGRVTVSVAPERPGRFSLMLRMPGWCRKAALKINGRSVQVGSLTRGYARINRQWRKGDRVELILDMPVERIEAHPAVRHDAGLVALQRGPLVYCLEEKDNGPHLAAIALSRASRLTAKLERKLLGGTTVITGRAVRRDTADWKNQLYRPVGKSKAKRVNIKAIPYCLWNNRGIGEMAVWIRER
ncbi:MAG: hypothetical protein C0404_12205 [Verrucomicrobia bacterium]|nr:hypothetical protein [Verrucomicrobiota bacterium]